MTALVDAATAFAFVALGLFALVLAYDAWKRTRRRDTR